MSLGCLCRGKRENGLFMGSFVHWDVWARKSSLDGAKKDSAKRKERPTLLIFLGDDEQLIRFNICERLLCTAGPGNFHYFRFRFCP